MDEQIVPRLKLGDKFELETETHIIEMIASCFVSKPVSNVWQTEMIAISNGTPKKKVKRRQIQP